MQRLAVALLLVLAGCGSAVDTAPEEPTATVTPAPVPTTDAGREAGELAPGLDEEGVFDAERLAAAHADALSGRSFTLVRTDRRASNGTLRQSDRSVLRFGASERRFDYDLHQTDYRRGEPVTSRIQRYADGERVYAAVTQSGETTYRLLRGPDGDPYDPARVFPANATNSQGLARLFVLVDTEVTDRRVVDGTTVYRVETPEPQYVPPLDNITLVANVSGSGLVRDYRLSYDVVRSAAPIHVVATIDYRRVGRTTVTEPAWLDEARAATGTNGSVGTPTG